MKTYKERLISILKIFTVFAIISMVAACSKVNQANYSQVKKGMNKEQVYSLLGSPTQESNVNLAVMKSASSVWKSGKATITVQFVNDKVVVSSFVSGEDSAK